MPDMLKNKQKWELSKFEYFKNFTFVWVHVWNCDKNGDYSLRSVCFGGSLVANRGSK